MVETPRKGGLSARSVALTVAFAVVGALWIRKASLLAFTILVGEGTPPVPALAALVLLTAAGYGLRRLTTGGGWRREALLVYVALTTTLVTIDANGVRQLLSSMMALRYFAAPGNDYAAYAELLPRWAAPTDEPVVRGFFEGVHGGAVPWQAWAPSLAVWSLAFLVFTGSLMCLAALFRRPWAEGERLGFPLAELALGLAPDPPERPGDVPLLKSPLFWGGFAVAALYNGSNIAHAFAPGVVAIGQQYNFDRLLTERPWSALQPMPMTFRPEIVGLGYLVPADVLASVWVFYLAFRFENLGAETVGHSVSGFPFDHDQAMGGYLALALFLVWGARRHLVRAARRAFGAAAQAGDGDEALPLGLAWWGLVGGMVALTAFMVLLGVSLGRAAAYTLLLYACCLVYVRVRSQTGLPITYIVPREDIFATVQALTPTSGRLSLAELRSETAFSLLQVLVRMTFPQLAAYEMEGFRIGERARIRRAHVAAALVLGLALGLAIGLGVHLVTAYDYGWNVLDGGSTDGGYRTLQAQWSYQQLETRARNATPIEVNSNLARLAGFGVTAALVGLRARFLRFPLHPMGLAIAGIFGPPIWFPIFLAWLCKTAILRVGGAHTYRALTPAFLGLAIGHFLIAGGIWGLVGAFGEDVARRYLLWFA
jgi:hypothetical protein